MTDSFRQSFSLCFHSQPQPQSIQYFDIYHHNCILKPIDFNLMLNLQQLRQLEVKVKKCQYEQFQSRFSRIIVLKINKESLKSYSIPLVSKTNKIKKPKIVKKSIQKDSRNVISNILRIFLKNVLEVDYYGSLIQSVIQKWDLPITKSQFYNWLLAFNINFKNYIRTAQIKRVFSQLKTLPQIRILLFIIDKYLSGYAISHCLTSKRIEMSAVKMHLQGLRSLRNEVIRWLDASN